MGRFVLVAAILGTLSFLISIVFVSISMLTRGMNAHRFAFLSIAYFAGGVLLFVVRAVAAHLHARMSPSRKKSTAHDGKDFYKKRSSSHRKHGAALVVVLSVLAIVTLLVARAQITAVQARNRDHAMLLKARLQVSAADAVREALLRLADDDDLAVDHTNETWAVSREAQDPTGITTHVAITDQNRFFNLNNLTAMPQQELRPPAIIVMDLLTLCGDLTPVERVDALLDWMDEDHDGFLEQRYYKDMGRDYGPANRSLYSWGEWVHVAGFDRDYFQRHKRRTMVEVFSANVVDSLAIIPGRRVSPEPVNVNTASATVLTGVLGLENEAFAALIVGTRNLRPIRSINELTSLLPPDLVLRTQAYLDTKSRFFMVHAWAYADGRTEHLLALAERNNEGNVTVLQWIM